MSESVTASSPVHVKSENADVPSFLVFKNGTSRKIDVYWIDYKGRYVKYLENFGANKHHYMNTFVTHPWMARDSVTNDALLMNGKPILYPPAWDGGRQRVPINIHVPVYDLKRRCMQILKDCYPEQAIPDLEIPRTLKQELSEKPTLKYREYEKMGRN